jgi:hypothetical protein
MGLGTAIKVWPAVTLLAFPRRTISRRDLGVAVFGFAALTVLGVILQPATVQALTNQASRGLHLESVAALPWQVVGPITGADTDFAFGAFVVDTDAANMVALLCSIVTLIVFVAFLWLWWREQPGWSSGPHVPLVALCALIVGSRVLSPQYLVWLVALGAVVAGSAGPLRRHAWWLLALAAVTQAATVFGYELIENLEGWSTWLIAARNVGLVLWLAVAIRLVHAHARDQASRSLRRAA